MALGFGGTSGTGSTDAVVTPYVAYPTTVSISVRFKQNTVTNGALVCKGTANASMGLVFNSSGASIWLAVAAGGFDLSNSLANGDGAYNFINTGTDQLLHHLLITWSFATVNTNPTWYLDGVLQANNVGQHSGGTVTSTFSTQAWQIGNSPSVSGGGGIFDGTICDVGIWNVVLANGLAVAKALSSGLSPLAVQPASLASYVPGFGVDARDWIGGKSTVTGVKNQNHLARAHMPRGRQRAFIDLHYNAWPSGIQSAETVGVAGLLILAPPAGVASGEAVGAGAAVVASGPASAASSGGRGVAAGTVTAGPAGIAAGEGEGSPRIVGASSPGGIGSGEGAGLPAGLALLSPQGIPSSEQEGTQTGGMSGWPAGIPSGEGAAVARALSLAALAGIQGGETVGLSSVAIAASLMGIAPGEAEGVQAQAFAAAIAGIPSAEAQGIPWASLAVPVTGIASDEAEGIAVATLPPPGAHGGPILRARIYAAATAATPLIPVMTTRTRIVRPLVAAVQLRYAIGDV